MFEFLKSVVASFSTATPKPTLSQILYLALENSDWEKASSTLDKTDFLGQLKYGELSTEFIHRLKETLKLIQAQETLGQITEPLEPITMASLNAEFFAKFLAHYNSDGQIDLELPSVASRLVETNGFESLKQLPERFWHPLSIGNTIRLLNISIERGYRDIASFLIDKIPKNVHKKDFGLVCITSKWDTIRVDNDEKNESPIEVALRHQNIEILDDLLNKFGSRLSRRERGSLICGAAILGIPTVLSKLLNGESFVDHAELKSKALFMQVISHDEDGDLMDDPLEIRLEYADVISALLKEFASRLLPNDKRDLIFEAVVEGRLEILDRLLDDRSFAELANFEDNTPLIEAQSLMDGDYGDIYVPIVERLLQVPAVRETAQALGQTTNASNLANIARFAENAMMATTRDENELIKSLQSRYTIKYDDKAYEDFRQKILEYLEQQYKKYPATDGYKQVWMLEEKAEEPVTFFPADTIGICPHGKECKISWYDDKGDLQKLYTTTAKVKDVYNNLDKGKYLNQALENQRLVDGIMQTFSIPKLPTQGKRLPLIPDENIRKTAEVAYFRHPVHNAWCYFYDFNPLMSLDADWVDENTRVAIIGEPDKKLLVCLWAALNDPYVLNPNENIAPNDQSKIKLQAGFTKEGNLNILVSIIKEINRGHNVDKRALYEKYQDAYSHRNRNNIATTREDDLKRHNPSCSAGVRKRIVGSCVFGHPFINSPEAEPLSPTILRDRMLANLVQPKSDRRAKDNLIDKISCLKKEELQFIEEQIEQTTDSNISGKGKSGKQESCIQDEQLKAELKGGLKIDDHRLDEFIEQAKLCFTAQRIKKRYNTLIYDDYTQTKHASYLDMIQYWAGNLLHAFSDKIGLFVRDKIIEIEQNESKNHDASHTECQSHSSSSDMEKGCIVSERKASLRSYKRKREEEGSNGASRDTSPSQIRKKPR